MTIRPRFPALSEPRRSYRIRAAEDCQNLPDSASRKRPNGRNKYLIERVFSATRRAAVRFFPVFSRTAGNYAVSPSSICDAVIALCRLCCHVTIGDVFADMHGIAVRRWAVAAGARCLHHDSAVRWDDEGALAVERLSGSVG